MNTTAYTTKADVEDYLGTTITGIDAIVTSWIAAASRWIDDYCNRDIYNATESTTKYDGDGSDILHIKDTLQSGLTVTMDGISVSPLLYPTTKDYASRLVLDDSIWNCGKQNISVTGKISMFSALPDQVKMAATILVAGMYQARNSTGKVGTRETIGNYTVEYKEGAQTIDYQSAKTNLSALRRIAV